MDPNLQTQNPLPINPQINPLAQSFNQTPSSSNNWIRIVLIFVILLVVGSGGYYYLGIRKNQNEITTNKKIQNTAEPNPKIEILAALPPEDPHIRYSVLFDPFSHIAIYSIDKDPDTATSSSTIVINGKQGKTYSGSDHVTISPDGKRVAYIAKQNDKEFVVIDGVEGKEYDYIKNLKFSPDGQHVAYAAGEEKYFQPDSPFSGSYMVKSMFIVVDTAERKKYDGTYVEGNVSQTYDPFFSEDGKKVTYTAIKNGKNIILIDDEELSDYSSQQYPQFIGNTYDIIYLVSENNKYFLVVAGQKKTPHDDISDIETPYYIGKDSSQIAYEAVDKGIRTIFVNDLSYPDYPDPAGTGVLQNVVFSKSGQNFAYYTGTWMSKDMYVNGKPFGNVQPDVTVTISSPLFSPDEQLLVYSEYSQKEQNGTIYIVSVNPLQKILDFPMKGFKVIGLMKFSDDGKSIYFKGWQNRKIVFVTLNVDQLIKGKINAQ